MNRATERVVDRIRRMVEHRKQMCLFRDGTVIHGLDKTHAALTAVLVDIDAACRPHCSRCQQELPVRRVYHTCAPKEPAA